MSSIFRIVSLPMVAASLLALPAQTAAQQQCRVTIQTGLAGGGHASNQLFADPGEEIAVNRSDVQRITNDRNRDVRVRVTIPTGGSKWVTLGEKQTDPPIANYIGNVTLQRMQCLTTYESPIAMFTAIAADTFETVAVQAVVREFGLGPSELISALQGHMTQHTVGVAMGREFGLKAPAVASLMKSHAYAVEDVWVVTDQVLRYEERDYPPTAAEVIRILRVPYGDLDAVRPALARASDFGLLSVQMWEAGYDLPEILGTTRQLDGGPATGADAIAALWGYGSLESGPRQFAKVDLAAAVARVYRAGPVDIARWLRLMEESPVVTATTLGAFTDNVVQAFLWLVQAGMSVGEAKSAAIYSAFEMTPAQLAEGLARSRVPTVQAIPLLAGPRPTTGGWGAFIDSDPDLLPARIVNVLREARYPADELATNIASAYSLNEPKELGTVLKAAGFTPKETFDAMRSSHTDLAPRDAAQALRTVHPEPDDVSFVLMGLVASYSLQYEVAVPIVLPWHIRYVIRSLSLDAELPGQEIVELVRRALPYELGLGLGQYVTINRTDVATWARNARYEVGATAKALRHICGFTFTGCPSSDGLPSGVEGAALAMYHAGYSADEIEEGISFAWHPTTAASVPQWLEGAEKFAPVSGQKRGVRRRRGG